MTQNDLDKVVELEDKILEHITPWEGMLLF